jgi:uncharacterized Tic20 family protein
MNTPTNLPLSSDEKLMGALAHVFGPLAAIIVWAIQKDKSRFVKFQALQVLAFDVIVAVSMGAFFFCIFGVAFLGMSGSMFAVINNPSSVNEVTPFFFLPFMFPFMIFGCIFPFSFALMIVRIIAAISILNGRNYHYPVIGKWLDNFLEK